MIKRLFFLLLTCVYSVDSFSSHAAGMDLTYECIGGNTYRVTLKFYRECSGIDAPSGIWLDPLSYTYLDVSSASCGLTANLTLTQVGFGNEISPICPGVTTTCSNL
ncbi:MAG: hypothetical protein HOB15_03875, partial [Flavobacteriales bacterium]|nr:hypothetical protein [Flavobacteriales bacterium]